MAAILSNLDAANRQVPKDGDSLVFEFYSKGGKEYVRANFAGGPVTINGVYDSAITADDFWEVVYAKTYSGDENAVCEGFENPEAHQSSNYPSFKDFA